MEGAATSGLLLDYTFALLDYVLYLAMETNKA